jgi:CheY-like chemotaxis protein
MPSRTKAAPSVTWLSHFPPRDRSDRPVAISAKVAVIASPVAPRSHSRSASWSAEAIAAATAATPASMRASDLDTARIVISRLPFVGRQKLLHASHYGHEERSHDGMPFLPPRVLIVMPDQWPRALLRAALREVGYDAVGAGSLAAALRVRSVQPERGPVRLIIVDQHAHSGPNDEQLTRLLARHGEPATMLLARTAVAAPARVWQRVLRRPVSIAEIVTAVQTLLPLLPEAYRPLD